MKNNVKRFKVTWYAGTYHGSKWVTAEDREDAVRKVRALVRQEMTAPMYADGYQVTECRDWVSREFGF